MVISTKGKYAVLALFYLALHDGQMPLSAEQISSDTGISKLYLVQIFTDLRRGGLITSVAGKNGGYLLADSPEEITVGDAIRCAETDFSLVPCLFAPQACPTDAAHTCLTRDMWCDMSDAFFAEADSITLHDLTLWWEKERLYYEADSQKQVRNPWLD